MEKLISDKEVFQKERPNKITDKQRKEVFNEVAEDILKWRLADGDKEAIADDLEEIYSSGSSGFELAKELEDIFSLVDYEFKSDLIETLEGIDGLMHEKKRKNVIEWVKAHDIKPKLKEGQKLKLKSAPFFRFDISDEVYINYLREETAQYVVDKDPNRKGGTLIDYELLEGCI